MSLLVHHCSPAPSAGFRWWFVRIGTTLCLLVGTVTCVRPVWAQQFINQTAVTEIVGNQKGEVELVPEVFYEYFVMYSSRNNTVQARQNLYKVLGRGDVMLGKERSKLVGLINRKLIPFAGIGDTLVVPTEFDVDFRAFSPFPRYYAGAKDLAKLFIIHKSIQAFAAYEYGKLIRWGIVNSGAATSPTPNGRYNFNWKAEYKVSTLSPPDEPWEMYWVFNFHQKRGIHIHQYAMPTGGPQSHGCVRMVEDDAKFIYDWADSWKTSLGNGIGSEKGRLIEQGTTVIVVGDDPVDAPHPFIYKKRYPVLKMVGLPENPFDVPAGTPQQEQFDKLRLTSAG